jgi:hypothetical protein
MHNGQLEVLEPSRAAKKISPNTLFSREIDLTGELNVEARDDDLVFERVEPSG